MSSEDENARSKGGKGEVEDGGGMVVYNGISGYNNDEVT